MNKTQKPEIVYSRDGEYFNDTEIGDLFDEVKHQAIDDGVKVGEHFTIYQGESTRFGHSSFINMGYIIEIIQESAYDTAGEYGEDYLSDLTHKKAKELESLIVGWFDENVAKPKFYDINNIKEIKTEITQAMLDEFHNE